MNEVDRLRRVGVARLEWVFQPAGLPLVDKGDGRGGTTSILVRGTAGSGKTTFALAISQSIALHQGGVVFYLTTEFSPAEILFKAEVIGLAEDQVAPWSSGQTLGPGSVLVESLGAHEPTEELEGSTARKLAAFEAVYRALHPEDGSPVPPVRTVVIDALTLPEDAREEGTVRDQLLKMIQGLEHEGISTILVEEAAPGALEWAAFVVDVVFELHFSSDPDTGELCRKLICRKCRYSFSVSGPHDYGLCDERPALFPTSLRVVAGQQDLRVKPLPFAVPAPVPDYWSYGGIVLSIIDKTNVSALRAIDCTPGARILRLYAGATSRVQHGGESRDLPDTVGAYGLGWTLMETAIAGGHNTCLLQSLEALLQRDSWRYPLVHVLEALRRAGLLVVVHGSRQHVEPLLQPSADLVWGGAYYKGHFEKPVPIRRAERWLLGHEVLPTREAQTGEDLLWLMEKVGSALTTDALTSVEAELSVRAKKQGLVPLPDRLGTCIGRNAAPSSAPKTASRLAALAAVADGNDWLAAHHAVLGFRESEPDPDLVLVWKCVCASVAQNPAAVSELGRDLERQPMVVGPLIRGLGHIGKLGEADALIATKTREREKPDWLAERFRAELRLQLDDTGARRDARDRLEILSQREDLPVIHRADILHNLGVAEALLGNTSEALRRHSSALELNPFLEIAQHEIERLGRPETNQQDD